jgi:AsmA protein
MNAKKKIVIYILGGVAVAIVLAAIVFTLTFDLNFYRFRIEAAASGATGLEVRINGKLGLSFFPFGLSAKDIHIANKGFEIISIDTLKLGAELMPLLKNQLKVISCELFKPTITIVKDADGKYDFEGTEHKSVERVPGVAFTLNELKLSKGVLVYLDKKTDEKTEFKDFNMAMKGLLIGETSADIVKNLSFSGSFDCK